MSKAAAGGPILDADFDPSRAAVATGLRGGIARAIRSAAVRVKIACAIARARRRATYNS